MPQGDLSFQGGGAPIAVATTASPGTVIFTCVSGGQQMDAVRILASNTDTTNTIVLTLEVAGTAASNQMCWSIPPLSTFELPIMRGNSGAVIRAFASIANKINCYRDANRYTL